MVSGTPFLSGTVCGTLLVPFFWTKDQKPCELVPKRCINRTLTHNGNIKRWFCEPLQFAAGTSAPAAAIAVARQAWQQRWDRRPKTKDLEPKIAIGEMLGNINWQCIHVKMHSSIHILKGFQFVFDQLHTFWMQDLHLCAPALMFLNPESTHLKKNRAWSKMCGYMIRAPGSMVSWREMIQIDCPGIEANHGAPVCLIAGPVSPLAFRGAKTAYWIPTTKLFCRQCTTWYPLHVLVGLNLEAKNKSRGKGLIVVLVHAVVLQVMRVPLMGSGLLGCAYVFYGKPEWILWSKLTFPSSYTFSVCQPWLLRNSCP